jgi:hypothetical protein
MKINDIVEHFWPDIQFISSASASLFTGGWLLGIEEINRHPFVFFCNLFKHYTYFSLFG